MKKYTQLTREDRQRLEILLLNKVPKTKIAKRLGHDRSTIYRELARNGEEEHYGHNVANTRAKQRRYQKRGCKLDKNLKLRILVITCLYCNSTPESVANWINNQTKYSICHETIYQYVYKSGNQKLYQCLIKKQSHRYRRVNRKKQRRKSIEPRLIVHRPKEVEYRQIAGHWEADSVVFTSSRKIAVITIVERTSRAVVLLKVNSRSTKETMEKIVEVFKKLPKSARKSITVDQGGEFADYRLPERYLNCKIYYCHVGSPWEKGTNENTNGRLRRYLPRNFDIANLTADMLSKIAREMNNTPRRCLNYKTPSKVFGEYFKGCDITLI
jgi:transposase, IS30 family